MRDEANTLYRQLPSVGEILQRSDVAPLLEDHPHPRVTAAARAVVSRLREGLRDGSLDSAALQNRMENVGSALAAELAAHARPRLRRVLNATGVILQTNLGRAPLSQAAIQNVANVAGGYSNLEFDLQAGERNRRDVLVEELVLQVLGLTGLGQEAGRAGEPAESSLWGAAVVNNCAAATFLGLNTLAQGGEVVVSRGELVEIGGGFRIPEILSKSGAVLREVGTTNKTRVADYAAALGPQTKLILRVHRSNFEIRGFTEQPSVEELVQLGRTAGVPVFDDQGTGCLEDLATLGLPGERTLRESVHSGSTLVAASGDKLLGGPQCGLLVGAASVVEALRANPLFRALRVDKLTYAALESTLLAYNEGRKEELPVIRMLRASPESLRERCIQLASALEADGTSVEVVSTRSVVGGGTTPGASLPSFAVRIGHGHLSEGAFAAKLRSMEPPVVSRVSEGRVLLDLRTVSPSEDALLLQAVREALKV